MSLFKFSNEGWFVLLHRGVNGSLSFTFNDQNYICFKFKIVGREDAQTKFGSIDLLCIIFWGGFEGSMWIISPTLILVPYLFKQKETK
jgi:hypothetical protein